MPSRTFRVVLAVVTALTVAFSIAAPVDARDPVRKAEPRRVTPFRFGRLMTPDTDILSRSGYAAWMIDEYLAAQTPLPRLGHAFLEAERRYGLNARYFVAHAMLESGFGGSDIARFKHNLFGYGAADRDPYGMAVAYRTHAAGVLAVAKRVRTNYLSPTGRWWRGFTTLRAVNRYYASDPHWADKIASIANSMDARIVTLRERRLRFGTPRVVGVAAAGSLARVEVPWRARPGARLPKGIRFAVRWTPLAVVEASAEGPSKVAATGWTLVARSDRGRTSRLATRLPRHAGLWRLEIEARDSDGRPLPATDRPAIRPVVVRVAAPSEVAVSLRVGQGGLLEATVRPIGREALPAAGPAGQPTVIEAWALPLDSSEPVRRLALVSVGHDLARGEARTIRFRALRTPAVVLVRVAGDPEAVGRAVPAVALVGRGQGSHLVATPLTVASPRDDRLLGRKPAAPDPLAARAGDSPRAIAVAVDIAGTRPAGEEDPSGAEGAIAAEPEDRPTSPVRVLVRTLAVGPGAKASATATVVALPEVMPVDGSTSLVADGIPEGVRLVVVGLLPAGATDVDPDTLRAAWIVVTTRGDGPGTPAK
jgi:Mannosyl-glycoprotein endo-beta-N-acetylglucosaminidase